MICLSSTVLFYGGWGQVGSHRIASVSDGYHNSNTERPEIGAATYTPISNRFSTLRVITVLVLTYNKGMNSSVRKLNKLDLRVGQH